MPASRPKKPSNRPSQRDRFSGMNRAQQLVASGCTFSEVKHALRQEYHYSDNTIRKYYDMAKKDVLWKDSQLDPSSRETNRITKLVAWSKRSKIYTDKADECLADPDRESFAPGFEHTALKYETLISKSLHLDAIPPELELLNSEAQAVTIRALCRNVQHVEIHLLAEIYRAVYQEYGRRIEEHSKDPNIQIPAFDFDALEALDDDDTDTDELDALL